MGLPFMPPTSNNLTFDRRRGALVVAAPSSWPLAAALLLLAVGAVSSSDPPGRRVDASLDPPRSKQPWVPSPPLDSAPRSKPKSGFDRLHVQAFLGSSG